MWGYLILVALFSQLNPTDALTMNTRRPKVSKRSRVQGSLPGPPTRPVYHSPPINAFSLKDLEPRDNERDVFESKPKTVASSGNSRAVSLPRPQQYHAGEQRYFSGSQQFLGLQPGGEVSAAELAEFGFSPDSLDLSGFKQSHEYGGFNKGQGYHGALNTGQQDLSQLYQEHEFGGFKYSPPTIQAQTKLLIPTYSKHQQSFYKHHNNDLSNHDAHYEFDYQVINHGDPHAARYGDAKGDPQFFGHSEKREGSITRGRYHVLLPDGRHQKVNYLANKDGYHAQVSYN